MKNEYKDYFVTEDENKNNYIASADRLFGYIGDILKGLINVTDNASDYYFVQ
jgi:hypothetical protein